MNRSPNQASTGDGGFTLMELLLALVLSGMIMTAAFGAVQLSWRYRSAGDTQVKQSQTIRGVLEDITLDLRSAAIPFRAAAGVDQANQASEIPDEVASMFRQLVRDEEQSGETFGPDIEERVLDFDVIDTVNPIHFYGESDFLVLLSMSKNYRFSNEISSSVTPISQVVWCGGKAEMIRVPFAFRNGRLDYTTIPRSHQKGSVVRIQQPVSSAAETSISTTVISEATQLSFRYFNGVEWKSKWNSHDSKQLPSAVEFTLDQAQFSSSQRFVIRLPQAGS